MPIIGSLFTTGKLRDKKQEVDRSLSWPWEKDVEKTAFILECFPQSKAKDMPEKYGLEIHITLHSRKRNLTGEHFYKKHW